MFAKYIPFSPLLKLRIEWINHAFLQISQKTLNHQYKKCSGQFLMMAINSIFFKTLMSDHFNIKVYIIALSAAYSPHTNVQNVLIIWTSNPN